MVQTKRTLLQTFFKRYWKLVILTFVAGTFNSLLSIVIPISIGKYYQLAFHSHSPRARFLDSFFTIRHLSGFFLFFSLLILLKGVFTFLEKYLAGFCSELFSKQLREKLFETQLSFYASAYDRKPAGKFLLRYSGDLSAIQRYVMKGVVLFSIDIIFLVFALFVLLVINWQMTSLAFGFAVLVLFVLYFLNNNLQRLTIKRRNVRSDMLSFVASRLHAIFTIKAFNREPLEKQKYVTSSDKLFKLGLRYFKWYGFLSSLIPVSLYAVIALVFYFSHQQRLLDKAHFPAHELLVYIMILLSLIPHFRRLLAVTIVWQAGNVSISKILRIFNEKTEARNNEAEVRTDIGKLEVRNLTFIHTNGKKVLEQFSAVFPENSITRLSGGQHSGKSTLFKLLLGIYPASSGNILLDGSELNTDNVFRFRKNITVVSDEFPLLGKTVFEAVSYSRKEEKREKALKAILDFGLFEDLNSGDILNYPLTLAGGNLSGVQRRQLLLVRSILTRKKIILLDEPFAGMDSNSKKRAVDILNDLKRKRNIIIISEEWPSGLQMDHQVEI